MRWEDSPKVRAGFGVGVSFLAGSRLLQWGGGHPQGRAGLGYHLESLPPPTTVKARSAGVAQAGLEGVQPPPPLPPLSRQHKDQTRHCCRP